MNNLWKYASYNDRERANMIKNGNEDVYTTEKAKNRIVRDATKALGMSTKSIDDWDNYIDSLNAASKKKSLPKFMSTRKSEIVNGYNRDSKALKNTFDKDSSDMVVNAIKSSEYLSELLANRGYSNNGSTYKKVNQEIEDELEYELDMLAKEYSNKIKSLRERYLKQL